MDILPDRIERIQSSIGHPVLLKKKENLLYLTGAFFDEHNRAFLLVKKDRVVLFTSGLERPHADLESDALPNIGKYLAPGEHLEIFGGFTFAEGKYLKSKLGSKRVMVTIDREPVDALRMVKDAGEIRLIRKAMEITGEVFGQVKKMLSRRERSRPFRTEAELAGFIRSTGLTLGADDVSFPPIVACGKNSAIPHHEPGKQQLRPNQPIILDFGFKYKNYCSDFTRTVFLGSAPKKIAEVYGQVEKAYQASLIAVDRTGRSRPAPTGEQVFRCASSVLAEKNLDKHFIHALGHGVGLEIHEAPYIGPGSKDMLEDGMVFAIEPGAYLEGIGGVRIEDLVYLEKGTVKRFIEVPTELKENIIQ